MDVISLVLTIAIAGFLVWLVLQVPMLPIFKNIIVGIVCVALVIWVLQAFGVATHIPNLRLK